MAGRKQENEGEHYRSPARVDPRGHGLLLATKEGHKPLQRLHLSTLFFVIFAILYLHYVSGWFLSRGFFLLVQSPAIKEGHEPLQRVHLAIYVSGCFLCLVYFFYSSQTSVLLLLPAFSLLGTCLSIYN